MLAPTLIRGSSEATGSWNTICTGRALPLVGHVTAVEQDPSGGQRREPDRGPGQRRLAGTRLADQADDLALADLQVDVLDGAASTWSPGRS